MPIGSFANSIPPAVFLLIHAVLFVGAAVLASRAFRADERGLGTGLSLYAVGEILYMTYHLDWTVFLFAHTLAEVFMAAGFVVVFASVIQRAS